MPTSMKMHRRRWALSQRELSHLLLGISTSALARYESGACVPPFKVVVALGVVFGPSAIELYPRLFAEVEDSVMQQAASFSIILENSTGTRADIKRELLAAIGGRTTNSSET